MFRLSCERTSTVAILDCKRDWQGGVADVAIQFSASLPVFFPRGVTHNSRGLWILPHLRDPLVLSLLQRATKATWIGVAGADWSRNMTSSIVREERTHAPFVHIHTANIALSGLHNKKRFMKPANSDTFRRGHLKKTKTTVFALARLLSEILSHKRRTVSSFLPLCCNYYIYSHLENHSSTNSADLTDDRVASIAVVGGC